VNDGKGDQGNADHERNQHQDAFNEISGHGNCSFTGATFSGLGERFLPLFNAAGDCFFCNNGLDADLSDGLIAVVTILLEETASVFVYSHPSSFQEGELKRLY
jgi:hypothetical protein